jgi:putative transposase
VLRSHCGGQRYAFNWGLALVTAVMDQRKAEASYDIPDAERTPSLNWSAYSLRKLWNQGKNITAPWWAENSKEAYSSGLANLATALSNWNASKTGKRRGPKVRFPRGSRQTTHVVPVHHRCVRVGRARSPACEAAPDRHHPHPRVDPETRAARRAWHRAYPLGDGVAPGRTLVGVVLRGDHSPRPGPCPTGVGGGCLGVKSLAVLSTGEVIPNPLLEVAQRELRRLQRQASRRVGPDRRTRQVPSARWRNTQARIAALHTTVANARRDGLHQLTTRLVHGHDTIVI